MKRAELYQDDAGEYRWRLIANNGRIVATSGEGYKRRVDCVSGLRLVLATRRVRLRELFQDRSEIEWLQRP